MFVGILIAFVIAFILVLAFKPNTKTTKVTKIDENGNKITELHQTEASAAGCAAKIIVWPILIIIVIIIIIVMAYM